MENYLNRLSPYIRFAKDSYVETPWLMPERRLFDYELLYVMEGHIDVNIEGNLYQGIPGDLFLFRPGQTHSIKTTGHTTLRQPHIHFDLYEDQLSKDLKITYPKVYEMNENETHLIRQDYSKDHTIILPSHMKLPQTHYFEQLLFEIINAYEDKLPYYNIWVKGLFIQLWTYLIREFYWLENPSTCKQLPLLETIKKELYNQPQISLDTLAATFNISKYHLIRLFKKAYHMTPIQYQMLTRIERCKELLLNSSLSITEIAEETDFSSIHSMSRAFKKVDGVSPSFYRQGQLTKE